MDAFFGDPRAAVIKMFYRNILGRDPDEPGMATYLESGHPLEMIYMMIYSSAEAENKRKEELEKEASLRKQGMFPISLAMFVRDNEDSVAMAINSVKPAVREVVVLDTGSVDNTVSICKDLGARVYQINTDFLSFDFGQVRTLTGHLSRQEWVLGLDSDEVILEEDYDILGKLIYDTGVDAWGLPRKRWLELEMKTQLEPEVYPDWQFRLFRNKTEIFYRRRIHEVIDGTDNRSESPQGPHIHHFQDAFKSGPRLKNRNKQYKTLQKLDVDDGIKHTEQAVQDIDER